MAGVTGLLLESFEVYGSGDASIPFMLSGNAFSELLSGAAKHEFCGAPSFGANNGQFCLVVEPTSQASGSGARRTLDTTYDEQMYRFWFAMAQLPASGTIQGPLVIRDIDNADICSIAVGTTGVVSLTRGGINGTVLAASALPVIVAGTWQYFEMYVKRHASAGVVTLYIDDPDTPVIAATGLALGAKAMAQVVMCRSRSTSTGHGDIYMDDFIARKVDVADTPVFWGSTQIATGFVNADTDVDGWTPFPRKKLGVGILDTRANNNSAVSAAQSTDFDLGAGDFTIETFVRFITLASTAGYQAIVGKWTASGNLRSWQLLKFDPATNDGHIAFRISTDGQAGTVENVIDWPWPDCLTNTWYFVTVQRAAGEVSLYIDGILQGSTFPDVNTYATVSAALGIAGEMSGSSSVVAGTRLNGFSDELRITKGVARYSANFAPPTEPFPSNVGGDPYFADVKLLAAWDSGIVDSSLIGRTLTARNGAVQETPDDGGGAYRVINNTPPRDDTFVQAALTRAGGVLTLNANAANLDTVTLGSDVYEFKTVLADPYDVLIGSDMEDTLANLIAAINQDPGEGTIYGTGTIANTDAYAEALPGNNMQASAIAAGTAGNAIDTLSSLVDGGWAEATLTGGADIPGPSEFRVPRLPFDATIVRGVTLITRSAKTAAGDCTVQVSFVGPGGASIQGADNALSTNLSYRRDSFETDPDTSGALTPSTIAGARIRLNRTA